MTDNYHTYIKIKSIQSIEYFLRKSTCNEEISIVLLKIELFTTGRMTITNYEKTLKICKIVVHSSKSLQIKIVKSSLVNQIKNGSRGGTVMKDMQN